MVLTLTRQAYPWLHAGQEGARFVYQLLYLVDQTPYYSPVLHALRQRVVRVSGTELVPTLACHRQCQDNVHSAELDLKVEKRISAACCSCEQVCGSWKQASVSWTNGNRLHKASAIWPAGKGLLSYAFFCRQPRYSSTVSPASVLTREIPTTPHQASEPYDRPPQAEADRRKAESRGLQLARARGGGLLLARLLREALLRAGYAVADHTRNALILSVFAFKVRSACLGSCASV